MMRMSRDRLHPRGRAMLRMAWVTTACRKNLLLIRSKGIACNQLSKSSLRTKA